MSVGDGSVSCYWFCICISEAGSSCQWWVVLSAVTGFVFVLVKQTVCVCDGWFCHLSLVLMVRFPLEGTAIKVHQKWF